MVDELTFVEDFLVYTKAEFAADRAVHVVGVAAALTGGTWLLNHLSGDAAMVQVAATWVYVTGLLGMLSTLLQGSLRWQLR